MINERKKLSRSSKYAIGMAQAKKEAGIEKAHAEDLPKSVIKKAHKIAKAIPEAEGSSHSKNKNVWVYNKKEDKYYGPFDSMSIAKEVHPADADITYKELPANVRNPRSVSRSDTALANKEKVSQAGKFGKAMESKKVTEKWAGDAEVKSTGQYEDKTKAELKAMLAKLHKSGPHKKGSAAAKKQQQINFALRAKGGWKKGEGAALKEVEQPTSDNMSAKGAGLGAGRNKFTLEQDMSDKKDQTKKKKKVTESMNTKYKAAWHEGRRDGLREQACRVKHYEDMEEAKHYYEGWKSGCDECYGMKPVQGLVIGEGDTYMDETYMDEAYMDEMSTPPATVPGMASDALDEMALHDDELNEMMADLEEMSRGEYIKHMDKKAEAAGKDTFNAFGQEFKTDEVDEGWNMDEAWTMEEGSNDMFESLDKQLNELLNEGLSVSVSTGQPGMQGDSVSVNATDDDAAQLLDFVKKVGLGGLGQEHHDDHGAQDHSAVAVASDYGAPVHKADDHEGMLAIIKKMSGGDYEQESDEGSCGCEAVSEMETDDQREFQVAEDAAEDAETAETTADEESEAKEDEALAIANMKEGIFGFEDKIYVGSNNVVHIPDYTQLLNQANIEASRQMDSLDMLDKLIKQLGFEQPVRKEDDGNVGVHLYFPSGVDVNRLVKLLNSIMEKGISSSTTITEWANDAGKKGTDEAFQADIDFMTNVITAGLNGRKSTGQTTVPVIAGQKARMGADSLEDSKDSIAAWQKLSGIK